MREGGASEPSDDHSSDTIHAKGTASTSATEIVTRSERTRARERLSVKPCHGEIDDDRHEDDEVARDGDVPRRTDPGDRVGDGAQIAHRCPSGGSTAAVGGGSGSVDGGTSGLPSKPYQRPFHQPHAIGNGKPPR